jgi:hypothetical protein
MFSAGWAKLRSGDPTWRDLTALTYHFETQPLPTWLGYYCHRLPAALSRLSVLGMFLIELGAPMLILARRTRPVAFVLFVGLMLVIAATGNYGFFNLLAIVLCVPLVPDRWLERVLPEVLLERLRASAQGPGPAPPVSAVRAVPAALRALCAACYLLISLGQVWSLFARRATLPPPLRQLVQWTAPFHVSSRYGLFAVMTTSRPEIILEGSRDGQSWTPYEFKYKPGELRQPPRWAAPHQPRLDWQMWFAAMRPAADSPWFQGLCIRLLQGSPDVLWLLARDPFAGRPPRYLRARLYQYRYTTASERAQTGAYWHRDEPGEPYLGPVSLGD